MEPAGAEEVAAEDVRDVARALSVVLRRGNVPRVQEKLIQDAGLKLDRSSYWLLRTLSEDEPARVSELASRQGTDVSTACRQVARCEQAGLVHREGDPRDLRAVLFSLTDAGRDTLARLQTARLAQLEGMLSGWTVRDRRDLARLLSRFATTYLNHTGAL